VQRRDFQDDIRGGSVTITIHVNPTDTAKDFDRAIEGLKRMRKEMFKPVKKPRKTKPKE
jgi:hypothetical protein